jgi:hypothetical protein
LREREKKSRSLNNVSLLSFLLLFDTMKHRSSDLEEEDENDYGYDYSDDNGSEVNKDPSPPMTLWLTGSLH